jgi:hypothetical protein
MLTLNVVGHTADIMDLSETASLQESFAVQERENEMQLWGLVTEEPTVLFSASKNT